jgi:hypothetical protein
MGPVTLYIPLRFWFNKNPGTYLPLLAMQYHPVRINVTLAPLQSMFYASALYNTERPGAPQVVNAGLTVQPAQLDIQLWGDYVFLDVPERRRFVSSKHEYLIEQVQQQKRYSISQGSIQVPVPLVFNNPLKEMIWVVNQDRMLQAHEWFNYGSRMLNQFGIPNLDLIASAQLQFDGYDRFEVQQAPYFRLMQPWQRHTAIPNDFIYVYSFSLAPEAEQPMGTCNASRLDSIVLQLVMNPQVQSAPAGITTYATNYNVLRIVAGLGGVLFTV